MATTLRFVAAIPAANLLRNGGFESEFASWTAQSPWAIGSSSYEGTRSAFCHRVGASGTFADLSQTFNCDGSRSAIQRIVVRGRHGQNANTRDTFASIDWFTGRDGTGSYISTSFPLGSTSGSVGPWAEFAADIIPPVNARSGVFTFKAGWSADGVNIAAVELDAIEVIEHPVIRLDLNSGQWSIAADPPLDVSPPPLIHELAENALSDGAVSTSRRYGNRTIATTLSVASAGNPSALAGQLALLHRELTRPLNIVEFSDGQTNPVFFRTLASPSYTLNPLDTYQDRARIALEIQAQPFAYGHRLAFGSKTLTNDPAVGSGPLWDLPAVEGDIPSPAILQTTRNGGAHQGLVVGVRQRGTPGNVIWFRQAEAFTPAVTDTTSASDATASGGASMSTTFAVGGYTARLMLANALGAASVDLRGTYRVFARLRANGGTFDLGIAVGPSATGGRSSATFEGPKYRYALTSNWTMVDLGLFALPLGPDPVSDGSSAIEQSVSSGLFLAMAERISGTDALVWDYLFFMPADKAMIQVSDRLSDILGAELKMKLDGPNDVVYMDESGVVTGVVLDRVGGIPALAPGEANRLLFLAPDHFEPNAEHGDVLTRTVTVDAWYYPRHLYVGS